LLLNSCASLTQITEFEAKFGLSLPDEYREFITQIGNGGYFGGCHIGALSTDEIVPSERGFWVYPTAFSLRSIARPDGWGWDVYHLLPWHDLTALEQAKSGVALCLSSHSNILPALVLSGPQVGRVHHGRFYAEADEDKAVSGLDGLPFLDWLERMLDLQAY
jgi:hypothetical protein